MKKKTLLLSLLILLSFPLESCSSTSSTLTRKVFAFDTYFSINLYGEGKEKNLDDIETILMDISHLADGYVHYDGIYNLYDFNTSTTKVTLDPLLDSLLAGSLALETATNGYFNPLIGGLSNLWKDALENEKVPSDEEISSALKTMNASSLKKNEDGTYELSGGGKVDLGAVAKGYALSSLKDYFKTQGLTHYLVDGGSSSILLGEKNTSDGYFKVGLKNLSGYYLLEKNNSISTSSIYEQAVTINGVTYSHIINPYTGKSEVASPLVITLGDDPFTLDAYSTAFAIKGDELGKAKEAEGVQSLFSDGTKITYKTSSLDVKEK
jgi:thiamine biosynthesis lipoprotein